MTIKEVIDGFREGVGENVERNAYADELFQEAVRIGMELNMQYHTPEEIREIMGRLIGKKVDDSFRMFPPFYTDFGKNITIGKMSLSIPDAIFRIREEYRSGMERSLDTMWYWQQSITILTRKKTEKITMLR